MHGLRSAAVMLLAPAIALAAAIPKPASRDSTPSVLVELHHYENSAEGAPVELSFRLDVLESSRPCGQANVTIDGQALFTDHHGQIALKNGAVLMGSWESECLEEEYGTRHGQSFSLEIGSVDDRPVNDLSLQFRFSQVAPRAIWDVKSTASLMIVRWAQNDTSPVGPGDVLSDEALGDFQDELDDLAVLQSQAEELNDMIRLRKAWLKSTFGWPYTAKNPECSTWRCHVQKACHRLSNGIIGFLSRHAPESGNGHATETSEALSFPTGSRPPWREADLPRPPFCKFPSHEWLQDNPASSSPQPGDDTDSIQKGAEEPAANPEYQQSTLLKYGILGLLVCFCLVFLHRRCSGSRGLRSWTERRAARRGRRQALRDAIHERLTGWKEHRRARRLSHRRAIRDFFASLRARFASQGGRPAVDEEKAGMLSANDHAVDEREYTGPTQSEATTMEEELASFRSVADVVELLVSSTEPGRGRSVRSSLEEHRQQQIGAERTQPASPHATFSHLMSRRASFESEELPPYRDYDGEEGGLDQSIVSNGFSDVPLYEPREARRADVLFSDEKQSS